MAACAAAPILLLGLVSLIHTVSAFSDPCLTWAPASHPEAGGVSASLAANPKSPCAGRVAFTAQTRAQASRQAILVSGGLIAGSTLGLLGAFFAAPLLGVVGALILLVESAFIGSLAALPFAAALLFLWAARKTYLAQAPAQCKLKN